MSRTKRVTDPLDDKAKARLVGGGTGRTSYTSMSSNNSSGSEHDGGVSAHDDNESPCLSDIADGFFQDEESYDDDHGCADTNEPSSSSLVSTARSSKRGDLSEVNSMEPIAVGDNGDPVRNIILFHVLKAINIFSCLRSNQSMYRRNVMYYLRDLGFNAAICKANWESCGGLAGGNYEYIDVVVGTTSSQNRYILNFDFSDEFVIARPSESYTRMLGTLPRVFVGRDEDLKKIVKVISDAAKRSLKSKDLHFPPWRKNRYMLMKWFGPHRRTTNLIPMKSSTAKGSVVKYRSIGFEDRT